MKSLPPKSFQFHTLGSGSYGTAYRVKWRRKVCVLKVALEDFDTSLENELQMLVMLQGAGGAPRALAYCFEGRHALLMTFCGNDTLEKVLQGKLSNMTRLDLYTKVCVAIRQVHKAGVVHCDLKPNNILVEMKAKGGPKVHIIDFGVSLPNEDALKDGKGAKTCLSIGNAVPPYFDAHGLDFVLKKINSGMR